MTTDGVGSGILIAGRYRLEDLLTESDGARFWRATDTILARSVAVHAVPGDDPRAPGLLDAARVSATVIDPHLLRVLDCDTDGGVAWVVNEWGDGVSLDLMLQRGILPPSRAAWLTREVADAIAAGHAQGVAHGRLNPEAVLVTHAGAVKLIGFAVDASLETPRTPDPLYGELDEREADVINLAGLLYAGLTGRWPGVAPSAVPPAPRESRRPLRPRQVRAGVPRTLDAICDRVLHKEASQHAMPIETAHEIAAALADYVGDPGAAAPLDAAAMHAEPIVPLRQGASAADVTDATDLSALGGLTGATGLSAMTLGETPSAALVPPSVEAPPHRGVPTDLPDDQEGEATQLSAAVRSTPEHAIDPEDTQLHQEVVPWSRAQTQAAQTQAAQSQAAQSPEGQTQAARSQAAQSQAAHFPEAPERPLFAETERRVPPSRAETPPTGGGVATGITQAFFQGAAHGPSQHSPEQSGRAGGPSDWSAPPEDPASSGWRAAPGPPGVRPFDPARHSSYGTTAGSDQLGFWPFAVEPEEDTGGHTGREGRGWLRTAIVIASLLVLVIVIAVVFHRGQKDPTSSTGPTANPSRVTSTAPSVDLKPAAVKDFDPAGNPPEENPETAGNAIDGDPATSWQTLTYRGNPALGLLKPGVGLVVDLGSVQQPRSVTVTLKGAPTSFAVYAAPAGVRQSPDSLDQLDKVAERDAAPEKATVQLSPHPKTRYLLVWLTRLPAVPGGFRGEITDITVRS